LLLGKVRQQCHHVQNGRPFVLCALFRLHHNTQQVTNLGKLSPVRTIQRSALALKQHLALVFVDD
jgi:hypothetical protein